MPWMASAPVQAFIGVGANLGDAAHAVRQALQALGSLPQTRLLASSALYASAPVDACGPDFINAVAQLETTLHAPALLFAVQQLEQQAGRERPYRNAPRTLDVDVLLYGSAVMHSPQLTLPHPRMTERAFVLLPLAEIAPDLVSPSQLAAVATQRIRRLPS
jgi:2-amino-4-hydroxy-6-hydroxymethyldihydropteridine diphosphokinase